MRRSKKKEARRKRNNLLSGLAIIFLMVFSVLAFPLLNSSPSQGSFEYNNFTFSEKVFFDDQFFFEDIRKYYTVVDDVEVEFFFVPDAMSRVNASYENLSHLSNSEVVLFSRSPIMSEEFDDYYLNLVFFDFLIMEFQKNTHLSVAKGLLNHSEMDFEEPIINCDDASMNSPVIYLGNSSNIIIKEVEPFCFEVGGVRNELLMVSDYLIYTFYDII